MSLAITLLRIQAQRHHYTNYMPGEGAVRRDELGKEQLNPKQFCLCVICNIPPAILEDIYA
jgi:hypothetical protein